VCSVPFLRVEEKGCPLISILILCSPSELLEVCVLVGFPFPFQDGSRKVWTGTFRAGRSHLDSFQTSMKFLFLDLLFVVAQKGP